MPPVTLPIDQKIQERYSNFPGFCAFWAVYPLKVNKLFALQAWNRNGCEPFADAIIKDVQDRTAWHPHWQRGYAPNASTYINQHQWQDEIPEPPLPTSARTDDDWIKQGQMLGITARPGESTSSFIGRVRASARRNH